MRPRPRAHVGAWHTSCLLAEAATPFESFYPLCRMLEQINAEKNGKAILLALDWAKAFDSIAPAALVDALERFGIQYEFGSMVKAI